MSQSTFFVLASPLFTYIVVYLQLSMRKLLWDSQKKEDALPLLYYKQKNQTFNFKTKFVDFSGTGIWPKNRLRTGIWAKFGLENGIYTPPPPPPFRTLIRMFSCSYGEINSFCKQFWKKRKSIIHFVPHSPAKHCTHLKPSSANNLPIILHMPSLIHLECHSRGKSEIRLQEMFTSLANLSAPCKVRQHPC